jgi:methylthioribulose-1-phosphate dehydratase
MEKELIDIIRDFYRRGWASATGTNYSLRLDQENFLITRSGIHKERINTSDFLEVNAKGELKSPSQFKTSDETDLHMMVYRALPEVGCVLHTHSPLITVLSRKFESHGNVSFHGYEIQKALPNISTHEQTVTFPVYPNSQNIKALSEEVYPHINESTPGLILAGHGLYCWGKDILEAKKRIEATEFLFECLGLEYQLGGIQ